MAIHTPRLDRKGRRNSGVLKRLALMGMSTLISLLVLEVGARVFASMTHQERGMTFDSDLGWRPLPNVEKIGTVWGVVRPATTNSHGWRDRERTFEKPTGMLRAVAIGDSFTFGVGVDDGERFTDLLEGMVDDVEVINLGVAGYGTDQELRVLETQAFSYDPDAVILTVCVLNDLDDIKFRRMYSWPKPYYSLEKSRLRMTSPSLSWVMRLRLTSYLAEFLYQRLPKPVSERRVVADATLADKARLFQALIGRFVEETSDREVALVAVLAYGPDEMDEDAGEVARYVTSALGRAGVPWLDTRELFIGRSREVARMYRGTHWSDEGHSLVAEAVVGLLARSVQD